MMEKYLTLLMSSRVWVHILFWTSLLLLYFIQYPQIDVQSFMAWFITLFITALVVYSNLYLLFPLFFFQKKYLKYSLFLMPTIGLGAIILFLILSVYQGKSSLSLYQFFINILFFVILTSSFKFLREFFRKQAQLVKAENEQLKTELSLLKSQVNPHFLFNTLNNLYGLIIQNQNEQAGNITLKLSDLMRYLLESGKIEQVSLQKEIKFLEDYLALEKIRLANQADIRLEISGFEKEVFVAPLLFIPLVENAFKHGLQTISENNFNNFAHFSLSLQGNELYFEAKNSVGKNLLVQEKSGTGLENLRKRLLLIYPKKHLLEIEENERFFKVILQINL